MADEAAAVARLQQILDRYVLATRSHQSREPREGRSRDARSPELVQGGTRLFLVKVINEARRDRAARRAEPEQRRVFIPSTRRRPSRRRS